MQQQIKEYKVAEKIILEMTKRIRDGILDKKVPFIDALALSRAVFKSFPREQYFSGNELDISPYDDLHMERGVTKSLDDVYEMTHDSYRDTLEFGQDSKREEFAEWVTTSEDPKALTLEYMVNNALGYITYDW